MFDGTTCGRGQCTILVVAVGDNTHTGQIKQQTAKEQESEGGCSCGGGDDEDDEENAGAMQKKLLKLTVSAQPPRPRSASSICEG